LQKNLVIHKFDNGVTKEHKTYNGEGIKQADANLLAYPLGIIQSPSQIKKDLEYYEVRVPEKDTPAMTQAIFSLLYARLGDKEKAYHFFKDAYVPNLNPPFRVIAETKGGTNPYFITGAGGILQTVMMGFGGLRDYSCWYCSEEMFIAWPLEVIDNERYWIGEKDFCCKMI